MKKMIIKSLIFAILFGICVTILINKIKNEVSSEITKIEEILGEKIILNEDTLMIMDYSLTRNTYILENEKEIAISLAEKLIIE